VTEPPVVSVLMPMRNAERYVAEAVRSILGQTWGNFELLVLDDGSTDGSLQVIRSHAAADARVRLLTRERRGLVATLNEGLALARGEFIARMDADDISEAGRFDAQVRFLRNEPRCVAVGCWVLLVDPEGDPLHEVRGPLEHAQIDAEHLAGRSGAITHAASMFRTAALRAVGGYRHQFDTAEDLDLYLRLAEVGMLANLPMVLYRYRQHLGSVGHARHIEQRRTIARAVAEAARRRGLATAPPLVDDVRPLSGLEHQRKWAWWALGGGNAKTARKHARRVLMQAPWSKESWRVMLCALRGW